MGNSDSEFLRLYQEYSKAIRMYENAIKDRKKVRDRLAVRSSPVLQALQHSQRRPVGPPPHSPPRTSSQQPAAKPRPSVKKTRRLYLGPILGWAKVIETSPQVSPSPGPTIDTDRIFDQLSLKLYWDKKINYEDAKRAFFDYARRQNIEFHKERARNALDHEANLQYLGVEESEDGLKAAQAAVEQSCQNAWKLYQTARTPKSDDMIKLLLVSYADAQFVGLEGGVYAAMDHEVSTLLNSGRIGK